MKRKFILFLMIAGLFQPPLFAEGPGTTSDPLITKSYIDQLFRFRSMVIPSGDKIKLNSGTLLVVRSGRLKLRSPDKKGLIDLTEGKEILSGTFLPANHLLLVPDSSEYVVEAQALTLILAVGITTKD